MTTPGTRVACTRPSWRVHRPAVTGHEVPRPDVTRRPYARDGRTRSLGAMTTMNRIGTRLPVLVAACLLTLLALVHSIGLVVFAVIVPDEVLHPGLVFAAVAFAAAVTAVAAIPGLLRGRRTAWLVTLGWTVTLSYWGVYKVFVEREYESIGFLVVSLLIVALLLTPAARRHIADRSRP